MRSLGCSWLPVAWIYHPAILPKHAKKRSHDWNGSISKGIPMLRDEVLHFVELGVTTVDEGLRILYNVEN